MPATELGGWHWAVKAQIHSGGRGKAGGVKLCRTYQEVSCRGQGHARCHAGHQPDRPGRQGREPSSTLKWPSPSSARSISASCSTARSSASASIASAQGGMDDRRDRPQQPRVACLQIEVEPAVGLQPFQARELAFGLGPEHQASQPGRHGHHGLPTAPSVIIDATMVEINPLVVTKDQRILALDAKMSFDDNALFRRKPDRRDARRAGRRPA